jgi:hypothetical protein
MYIWYNDGTSSQWVVVAGTPVAPASPSSPQGRLTFATGTPVMNTSVSGATSTFYTPYVGRAVPLWNGTTFIMTDIGGADLSQLATDTTKSPAAVVASSNYDMFIWNDGGIIRCTRGPAWTSATARALALTRLNGFWVNSAAITNGPAANFGTYVGTVRSNASSTFDFIYGSQAAGGGPAVLNCWNAYNRVRIATSVQDSTASWAQTASTIVPANSTAANGGLGWRITFLLGLSEDVPRFIHSMNVASAASGYPQIGIGLDVTNVMDMFSNMGGPASYYASAIQKSYPNLLGSHFIQALQAADGTYGGTFYGTNRSALTGELAM